MNIIEHYVNGKKFLGSSKRTSKVFNPATGEQTAEVKLASAKDLDDAVQVAKKSFCFLVSQTTITKSSYNV